MDQELNIGEHLLKLVSTMKFVHLKQPFAVYLRGSFQEGCKFLLTKQSCQTLSKVFALDFNLFSLDVNEKKSRTRIEPSGTPTKIGLHDEVFPFKTSPWSLHDM